MNLSLLILSFHILFPVFTKEQLWLQDSLDFRPPFEKNPVEYYDLATVRSALGLASGQVAALSPEDELFEEDIPLPEGLAESAENKTENASDEKEKKSSAEKQYRNSLNRLAFFIYDVEQLSVSPSKDGSTQTINVNDKKIIRTKTDSHYRVQEKLEFKNSQNYLDIALVKKINYEYASESGPELLKVTEELLSEKIKRETTFSSSGDPVKVLTYVSPEEGKPYLERKTERRFDQDRRLVWEEEIRYDESGELVRRRNEYTHTAESSVPNLSFYENDRLRLKDIYLSDSVHEETMYFDDDYSVLVHYEHGRKTMEVIYASGKEISRKNFD